ncbi:MAG: alkyl sulfatase dimerization domain-containing protein [Desulfobacterales bacterium]
MKTVQILKKHLDEIVLQFGHHPGLSREEAAYFYIGPPEEVAPGVWHIYSLANSVTFICDDRLMQVDCNIAFRAPEVIDAIREQTTAPFDTLAITHGHVDHCMGTYFYLKDSEKRRDPRPNVIGHKNLRWRIDKNKMLEAHRIGTDKKQFQVEFDQTDLFVYPDIEFEDRIDVTVGGEAFNIVFGHGHTEDSLWVYCPGRKVLCCGDLFQWTAANVGNPFKMQRYALENAHTLEEMAAQGAEVLCPGHGPVIYGQEEIRTCLLTAAHYLHFIQDHVVACLNKGMILEETVNSLKMPAKLMNSKWLPPLYGHPVFIARGIFKRYAGYYSGRPAELFPPDYAAVGQEIVNLAGSTEPIITRVKELKQKGQMALACQLAEWVVEAEPQNADAWEVYGLLFKERAESEFNMQARGAWNQAVRRAMANLELLES